MAPTQVREQVDRTADVDLTTTYMGLTLPSPVVASAGPLSQSVASMQALEEAGVGAVVMYSLFEEQVRHEQEQGVRVLEANTNSFAEALSYFPTESGGSNGEIAQYLDLLTKGADALSIPLIASLNGAHTGGWTKMAQRLQDAGATGIELNTYFLPGDFSLTGSEVEQRHLEILQSVKDVVDIPVALKLSPYFSNFGEFAIRLDAAGADALVLFNRFLQPDIDINRQEVVSGFELSHPEEGRLPRTWIAALRDNVSTSLAATSGVDGYVDVVKAILSGADVVMTTSALVRRGAGYATDLLSGLRRYLARGELSLDQARGLLAVPKTASLAEYERSGYVSALEKAKRRYGV
ncbi:dihydroorotate dehydrogenase-like protein [Propionibacterium sp.]|uniref:dihydroorotate dehydrogenase-like protein n=1 Tax=Propionibacterium sp. TaxID=1977903 RepID=UPI0039EC0B92